jgi:hypothetical protein
MLASAQRLSYLQLEEAPITSGVYAWYYQIKVGQKDIDEFVRLAGEDRNVGIDPKIRVREFLDKHFFGPFVEMPYKVAISGPLKPQYEGEAFHVPAMSEALVERLAREPQKIKVVTDIIQSAVPDFVSPLYIGMADNLRVRLVKHKSIIIKLRDALADNDMSLSVEEAGLAKQIVARNLDPMKLFVLYRPVSGLSDEHTDIENILNRITFPLLGRN